MELLPHELTVIPVPNIGLLGNQDLWPKLTQLLNHHVLPNTTRESLVTPVGDLNIRLPPFRVCGSSFNEWYDKWSTENVFKNATQGHLSSTVVSPE